MVVVVSLQTKKKQKQKQNIYPFLPLFFFCTRFLQRPAFYPRFFQNTRVFHRSRRFSAFHFSNLHLFCYTIDPYLFNNFSCYFTLHSLTKKVNKDSFLQNSIQCQILNDFLIYFICQFFFLLLHIHSFVP